MNQDNGCLNFLFYNSKDDVANFLFSINEIYHKKYYILFTSNGFQTIQEILTLTHEDLKEMGILIGHRRPILKQIEIIRQKTEFKASFKTSLCYYWKKYGYCYRGENCVFAHGSKELRCSHFAKNKQCIYGNACKFIHDDDNNNSNNNTNNNNNNNNNNKKK